MFHVRRNVPRGTFLERCGMSAEELLKSGLQELDPRFVLSPDMEEKLRVYYRNLIEWNSVMNLTTITVETDVYVKHYLDSLSILKVLSEKDLSGKKLIDVGTGAGFPGLVLAICFPNCHVTLMDSLNKRIGFLNDTIQKLGITNAVCIHARAEELARQKEQRERYDIAVSRAVANLSTLSEYCLPFVRTGGMFIAFKSEKVEEELSAGRTAVKILGGEFSRKCDFTLPATEYERSLIVIEKKKATPGKYPRKAGTPSKDPLGVTRE